MANPNTIPNKDHHYGPVGKLQLPPDDLSIDEGQGAVKCDYGVGTPVDDDAIEVFEYGDGVNHVTVFKFTNFVLSTVDNGTGGHAGSQKLYDFPAGYIQILAGSQNWDSLVVDGTGLPNDSVVDIGVGSTAVGTDQEALSGVDEDLVNKDDVTFSSSLSALSQFIAETTGANFDGRSTAKDAYLNVAATAATADGDGTITLNGEIVIVWRKIDA